MINPTDDLVLAAFTAQAWHGGQGCQLYALSCGNWDALTYADIESAAREFSYLVRHNVCSADDDLDIYNALDACENWLQHNRPQQ
jgi:hypothetical protein